MKKLLFLMFLFCLSSSSYSAESFEEFNERVTAESNVKKLEAIEKQELAKYNKTKNIYYLYNAKYARFHIACKHLNEKAAIASLSWVIEDGKGKDKIQLAWFNYHMASNLNVVQATKIALSYAHTAINLAKQTNNAGLLRVSNGLVASVYYKLGEAKKSKIFYSQAFALYDETDYFNRSSMLNNIALCEIKLKNYKQAKTHLINSLELLKRIKSKNSGERFFYTVVEGNLGTVYHKLGDNGKAIFYLEKEVDYYFFVKNEGMKKAEVPLIELLTIYQKQKNFKEINRTLERMKMLSKYYAEDDEYPILAEAMFNYYSSVGDQEKAMKTGQNLYQKLTAYTKLNTERIAALNDIIYSDRLTHLKNVKTAQELKIAKANTEKQFFQFVLITVFSVFCTILIVIRIVNNSKKKGRLKDSLIEEQTAILKENKTRLLEKENKIQEEKIVNLAMNLNIKKETEKVFLSKINELKRKKNVDTETVLKELQISISNLMNVDKKLLYNKIETDDIVKRFKLKLSMMHPSLTKSDLEYCCYFRLDMSAKEIGSIHGQSDGSIRVLKNKIKKKLDLTEGISLFDYLIKIHDSVN